MTNLSIWLLAAMLGAAVAPLPAFAAVDPANPDWPCVQRKVLNLTSAQIWDGPDIDKVTDWSRDGAIVDLAKLLLMRRISLEEAEGRIKTFAAAQPEGERDAQLTKLFAGVLSMINQERRVIIDGIERFQRRQIARSKELERQGQGLVKGSQAGAPSDQKIDAKTPEEEKYDWDARVFQERQQSLPLACELPAIVEQRAFELARLIRAQMKS